MADLYTIVSGVNTRLGTANIPATLASGDIADMANDRLQLISQFIGQSIDSGNFAVKFVAPLRDMVAADVLATRTNTDIDADVGLGNVNLSFNNKQAANAATIDYYLKRAENQLNYLGRTINHGYTAKAN